MALRRCVAASVFAAVTVNSCQSAENFHVPVLGVDGSGFVLPAYQPNGTLCASESVVYYFNMSGNQAIRSDWGCQAMPVSNAAPGVRYAIGTAETPPANEVYLCPPSTDPATACYECAIPPATGVSSYYSLLVSNPSNDPAPYQFEITISSQVGGVWDCAELEDPFFFSPWFVLLPLIILGTIVCFAYAYHHVNNRNSPDRQPLIRANGPPQSGASSAAAPSTSVSISSDSRRKSADSPSSASPPPSPPPSSQGTELKEMKSYGT